MPCFDLVDSVGVTHEAWFSLVEFQSPQGICNRVRCEPPNRGASSWERWRLAGEFRFSPPDWPTGRRRSQVVHGEGDVQGRVRG